MNLITERMIINSGRSWWQARYYGGKILSEWDTLQAKILLPGKSSKTSRWEEVPKENMIALRILCPNGMAGELEAKEGSKFFQLKHGGVDIKTGFGLGGQRWQDAHIIGVVLDENGKCLCRAWQVKDTIFERGTTSKNTEVGTNTLEDKDKNWFPNSLLWRHDPSYALGNVIRIHGQTKTIWGNTKNTITIMGKWEQTIPSWIPYEIAGKKSELLEFEDNINDFKYLNIGKININAQQLKV
jgi:hypothetical protein